MINIKMNENEKCGVFIDASQLDLTISIGIVAYVHECLKRVAIGENRTVIFAVKVKLINKGQQPLVEDPDYLVRVVHALPWCRQTGGYLIRDAAKWSDPGQEEFSQS